jgi:hypothetical protein
VSWLPSKASKTSKAEARRTGSDNQVEEQVPFCFQAAVLVEGESGGQGPGRKARQRTRGAVLTLMGLWRAGGCFGEAKGEGTWERRGWRLNVC